MAGALSGHLVQSYESSMSNQSICTDGQISFNPSMHRSFNPNMHSTHSQTFTSSMSESVFDRVNRLQAKLNQKLGPEFISQRPGPGGGPKLTYAEGWKIINIANDVFGFDGWSSNIVNMTTDYIDYNEETRRYNVGISVIMRVTVKEGVYHEDVGYGMIENAKGKGMALDKCKKEAVTDALKRTLRTFGNVLGNCLYDKQYTAEVVKIKVPPIKFEKADLHRIPQLSEAPAPAASTSTSTSSSDSTSTAPAPASVPQQQKFQTPRPESNKPISAVPRNMQPTGLQTPITTPNHSTVERKVTFTPQVKVEPTAQTPSKPPQAQITPPPVTATHKQNEDAEDFGFFSDDDAFLSTVDLGEGDLGQPIDFEEGTGCISTSIQEESAPESAPVSLPQVAPTTNGRTAQGARLPAQQQQHRGAGAMPPPPNPPQHRIHGDDRGGTPATTGEKPISGWPAPPRPTDSRNAGGPPQARRPPSIGGFHFPPGMPNPFLPNQNPIKPPQPPQGVKRSADTMMCVSFVFSVTDVMTECTSRSSSVTRSGPGMGLSAGGGARQPLGTLVLEPQKGPQGGSDIKRVKR
ncbi:RAD52 DNA repair protein [Mycena pura]|uniref:RAD52 DNA repair protein n=1 Tax=Mycena pura TaxID=153505 RepID=A0AAD6Y6H1_9AGAR|nr:RAD52 DNA repair protein [Mycena pura]